MKKWWIIAVLLFVVIGCGGRLQNVQSIQWPQDVSKKQYMQDGQQCAYDAKRATAGQDNVSIRKDMQDDLFIQCMRLKGYTVNMKDGK